MVGAVQDRGRATVLPPNVGATNWLYKTCTRRNMDKSCTVVKLCKGCTRKKCLALCILHSTWAAVAGIVVSVRTIGRLGLCKIAAASVRKLRIPYSDLRIVRYSPRNIAYALESPYPVHPTIPQILILTRSPPTHFALPHSLPTHRRICA